VQTVLRFILRSSVNRPPGFSLSAWLLLNGRLWSRCGAAGYGCTLPMKTWYLLVILRNC